MAVNEGNWAAAAAAAAAVLTAAAAFQCKNDVRSDEPPPVVPFKS